MEARCDACPEFGQTFDFVQINDSAGGQSFLHLVSFMPWIDPNKLLHENLRPEKYPMLIFEALTASKSPTSRWLQTRSRFY
jgi:hypothetical protein